MMKLRHVAISGLLWSASDKLISQIFYFFAVIYIARIIGPEAYGLIGMISIFTILAENIVNNGFSKALIQRSHKLTKEEASTVFLFNIVIGFSIYFILYCLSPFIADFYERDELINIIRVISLTIIFNSFTIVPKAVLVINLDYKSYALANLTSIMISAPAGILLALNGYSYWAIVTMQLLRNIILNTILFKLCQFNLEMIFSIKSFKSLFSFGSKLMIAEIISIAITNLDTLLIGKYFNAISVGFFTQAVNVTNVISNVIFSMFQNVSYSILSSVSDDRDKLIKIYKNIMGVSIFFSAPVLAGFVFIAEELILICLGAEWLPALPIIKILCISKLISSFSIINLNVLNAIGRSDLFLKVLLIKSPISLITLFVSIQYGMEGIAWSVLARACLFFFINAYYPSKLLQFSVVDQIKITSNTLFSTFLMAVALAFIEYDSLLFSLCMKILIGALIYLFVMFFFKDETFVYIKKNIYSYINTISHKKS